MMQQLCASEREAKLNPYFVNLKPNAFHYVDEKLYTNILY